MTFGKFWQVLKSTISGYIADDSLSRGAAIAYYTVFSLSPVLVIVIAIAGLVFGADAARGAVVHEIGGLMGQQGAEAVQAMIQNASNRKAGAIATAIGVVTLLITASGVFSEMQTGLNVVWKARPKTSAVSHLVKVRLISLGLVVSLGFLLAVSLLLSTAISALDTYFAGLFPGGHLLIRAISLAVSFGLVGVLFGAIYKVLPDTELAWRDVIAGAIATSALFAVGKYLISLYIGSSSVASSYGAAGALAVLLVWIYYSSQIFLLGAEFTRAWADIVHGRRETDDAAPPADAGSPATHPELVELKRRLGRAAS
jgi:membrane protein